MYNKNLFDKNDAMLEDIMQIVNADTKALQKEYVDAAIAAGKEARGLGLAERKEIFMKHIHHAQEACGSLLGAADYVKFDKIAIASMNSGE